MALDPVWPGGFHLRGGQRVEIGRKLAGQLGQNRPRFAETDEPGRSDGGRRARSDKEQDAENPKVGVKNGLILSVLDGDQPSIRCSCISFSFLARSYGLSSMCATARAH